MWLLIDYESIIIIHFKLCETSRSINYPKIILFSKTAVYGDMPPTTVVKEPRHMGGEARGHNSNAHDNSDCCYNWLDW